MSIVFVCGVFVIYVFRVSCLIVDFVRCSVTFGSCGDLLKAVKAFIDIVSNNNHHSISNETCVIDVLRLKNGFNEILDWNDINDANYVDLKLNVLIHDSFTNINIIGEIQCLLKWLLDAKKFGHKVYNIVRRKEFLDNVSSLMNVHYDYKQYGQKIMKMVQDNNFVDFTKQIFWQPNFVLSILYPQQGVRPLLARTLNNKIGDMLEACLLHFVENYSFKGSEIKIGNDDNNYNESKENGTGDVDVDSKYGSFISRYYSYPAIFNHWRFWGIDARNRYMKQEKNIFKMKQIIESKYFAPKFDKNNNKIIETILYMAAECDRFDYLNDWIFNIKYANKFKCVITSGLNYCNKDKNNQSLFDMLISQKHCGEKWFDLLLFKSLECMKQSGITLNDKKQSQEWIVKESILKECYQTCDNSKWKQIMQKYAK